MMWAVSCMRWSPPLLYWKGLLEAARSSFGRFNPQDLANCVSAGAYWTSSAADCCMLGDISIYDALCVSGVEALSQNQWGAAAAAGLFAMSCLAHMPPCTTTAFCWVVQLLLSPPYGAACILLLSPPFPPSPPLPSSLSRPIAHCVMAPPLPARCLPATAVDVGSLNPRWLKDFAAASLPKLPAFQPVQLAHTVNALALAADSAQGGRHAVHAAWLSAFSQAAAAHLAAGRLRGRNLRMSVEGLQRLKFSPTPRPVAAFLARASAVIADEEEAITHSAGAGAGGSSSSEASSSAAAVW